MIAYIRGKIQHLRENSVVLDVNGVGYEVNVTAKEIGSFAGKEGSEVELYTHYYLRETEAELYGFSAYEEKDMFEILVNISGIGPKGALSVLSAASVDILRKGIAEGDTSVLTKVSGIGEKMAEKIIMELKDKVQEEWTLGGENIREDSDVVEALESLGYSKTQAQRALKELPSELTNTEDKVKAALKSLTGQ